MMNSLAMSSVFGLRDALSRFSQHKIMYMRNQAYLWN